LVNFEFRHDLLFGCSLPNGAQPSISAIGIEMRAHEVENEL